MQKILFYLLILSFSLFACNNSAEKKDEGKSATGNTALNPEFLVSFDMDVSGMTCTGCENTIESGVTELPGVSTVEALHLEAKTYVVIDTSLTSISDVKNAIEQKGYKVEAYRIKGSEEPVPAE